MPCAKARPFPAHASPDTDSDAAHSRTWGFIPQFAFLQKIVDYNVALPNMKDFAAEEGTKSTGGAIKKRGGGGGSSGGGGGADAPAELKQPDGYAEIEEDAKRRAEIIREFTEKLLGEVRLGAQGRRDACACLPPARLPLFSAVLLSFLSSPISSPPLPVQQSGNVSAVIGGAVKFDRAALEKQLLELDPEKMTAKEVSCGGDGWVAAACTFPNLSRCSSS